MAAPADAPSGDTGIGDATGYPSASGGQPGEITGGGTWQLE